MYRAVATSEDGEIGNPGSNCFSGIAGVLGLAALITGALYINNPEEFCPWSPTLPVFLLTYGVVSVCSPFLYCVLLMCGACTKSASAVLGCIACVSIIALVSGLGIIIWGFVLLYSNPLPVTYDKYGANSTVLNENYCLEAVYLVPMIISWSFVASLILTCLCLCCVKACTS